MFRPHTASSRVAPRHLSRRFVLSRCRELSAFVERLEDRCLLSGVAGLSDPSDLQDADLPAVGIDVVVMQSDSTGGKFGPLSKLNTSLVSVFHEYREYATQGGEARFAPTNNLLQVVGGSVVIDAAASGSTDALLADLEELGLHSGSTYGPVVSGLLPVDSLDEIALLDTLQFASAALRPWSHGGAVTSQGSSHLTPTMRGDYFKSTGRE